MAPQETRNQDRQPAAGERPEPPAMGPATGRIARDDEAAPEHTPEPQRKESQRRESPRWKTITDPPPV